MQTYTVVVNDLKAVVFDGIIAKSRLTYYAPDLNYFVLNQTGKPLDDYKKDLVMNVVINHAIGHGLRAMQVKKYQQPYQKKKRPSQPRLFD